MILKLKKTIVLNRCFGGFSLSKTAWELLLEKGYEPTAQELDSVNTANAFSIYGYGCDVPRDNPILVDVVRILGDEADGPCAKLSVVDVEIEIDTIEFDGMERISVSGIR
jgi:hypothetical protein